MNAFFIGFDWKQNRLLLLGLMLCIYFAYHLFYGPRSLPHLNFLQNQNVKLEHQLSVLEDKEAILEDRVVKLRPETLDQDLLKERAREMLGYVGEGEIVVIEE